ncbi:MAG: hypothetical protein TYPL_3480 [Candidatus Tyloplasma litorale]|nr:MAG: hypothetical protein TYPL_3480 [Mycoplasmatales bacterium]
MINTRKDIVTKKKYNRDELIRISISKNGETQIDDRYNLGGRGIYVHPKSIDDGVKKNIILNNIKRFKGKNYEKLIEEIKKEAK